MKNSKVKSFIVSLWGKPSTFVSRYLFQIMVVVGVLLYLISYVLAQHKGGGGWLAEFAFWIGLFEGVSKLILGAGVFGVLIKSQQFTDIFKGHIYDVIFSPQNYNGRESLLQKWRSTTEFLLKDVIPERYENAASAIEKQFLDGKFTYHFEDYIQTYDIESIDPDNPCKVSVNNNTATLVIAAPNAMNACIEQRIKHADDNTDVELVKLMIDDKEIDFDRYEFKADSENKNVKRFRFPFPQSSNINAGEENQLRLDRTYRYDQDLSQEPYFYANIIRYVKGLKVRVKADGYDVILRRTGCSDVTDPVPEVDGFGYTMWVLSDRDQLILPGQGYIIIARPE